MARSSKYIILEGVYERNVLGIFTIIRGFANLKDLEKISVPYKMADVSGTGIVTGHQREINPQHAEEIKTYLEKSDTRFIPEIILSVRTTVQPEYYGEAEEQVGIKSSDEYGIVIKRKYTSRTTRIHNIIIDISKLSKIVEKKLIRRIDGNHRLWLAKKLAVDFHSPTKYLAPFCMIILGPPENAADDYAESKIFHTINSKAFILESEHALKLLLGQNPEYYMSPEQEFSYDPVLHLTRIMRDKINGLPDEHKKRLGARPLTCLAKSACALIELNPEIKKDRNKLLQYSDGLFAEITEVLIRIWHSFPNLCKAEYFIELSACVWEKYKEINDNTDRINQSVRYIENLGKWIGEEGFVSIDDKKSFAQQLLQVYESVICKIPKRVFLARWYPDEAKDGASFQKASLRLKQIKETLKKVKEKHKISLELIDLATEAGGTYLIHPKMYRAIESSDIVLIDLSGQRNNVYAEAGYAIKHQTSGKLLFLFEPETANDKVEFDLRDFRYEKISQAAEIPDKLMPHITAILENSGANI